ncbi:MAG: hypothetical protein ACP5Q5_00590 [Brevinematia bacterium]
MKFINLFLLLLIFYGCDSFDIDRIKHERDNELDPNKLLEMVATPIIFPESILHTNSVSVNILCSTPGATIYWTTNNGVTWTTGYNFILSTGSLLIAKAKKSGMIDSLEATNQYNIVYNFSRTYGGNFVDEGKIVQKTSDGGFIIGGGTSSFGSDDIWIIKLGKDFNIEWQKTYGGDNLDDLDIENGIGKSEGICETSDAGYVVAGYTKSFGDSDGDVWVLKLNRDGNINWQKRYGGDSFDCAYSIQQTSDGGYIVAGLTWSFGYQGSLLVLKLNSSGEIQWAKIYGGNSYDYGYSIKEVSTGGYIVVGQTYSFGGNGDIWVLRLNNDGTIAWQKRYGGNGDDRAYSIIEVSDGFIVVGDSGYSGCVLKIRSNDNGSIESSQIYSNDNCYIRLYSIQQIPEGYLIVGKKGFGIGEEAGKGNGLILKISNNNELNIIFQKSYGTEGGDDTFCSIQDTADGGFVALGYTDSFSESVDLWVVKLFSNGYLTSLLFNENIFSSYPYFDSYDTSCVPVDVSLTVEDTYCNTYNTSATITQQAP